MKKLAYHLNHFVHSISTKVLILMLVIVVPFNVLAISLGERTMDTLTEQAEITVENVMNTYLTNLLHRMETTETMLYNMRFNEADCLTMVKQAGDGQYQAAKIRFFYEGRTKIQTANMSDVSFFYMKELDDVLVWNKDTSAAEGDKACVRESAKGDLIRGWSLGEMEGRHAACLFIDLDTVIYGGWIYLDTVIGEICGDIQYEKATFVFSDQKAESILKKKVPVSAYCKKGSLYLNGMLDIDEITGNLSSIYRVMRWGTFVALFLIPVLYLMVQHLLLKPLRTLNRAQKKLQEGDLDYRIKEKANSIEYEHSFQSFNEMAQNIQSLKIENYEKELARREMELKNLQLQIRPHFLLNTFNLIYNLAQRGQEDAIQKIIIYLSDYFRYLFRSGNSLELFEKEQHLLEAYIETASVRYPGCIEIEYEYDPEIAFVRVPPLLLHNFVENIVKYVVKPGKVTHISIVGQYENSMVSFMVMDDGPGMTEEELRELDSSMREPKKNGEHIGFANSYQRIKYFYGDEGDITITAEPGEGTCVTISFPYDLEVPDESADRE